MSLEDQHTDRKSLRTVSGKSADWAAMAQDAVCFANGTGGRLLIGIEDGQALPPPDQRVEPELLDRLRKRIGELTVNVQALPRLQRAANGGEFIELLIDRSPSVASTRDGRYFLRVGDCCQPVLGDDVLRLANERPGRPWEAMDSAVQRHAADDDKLPAYDEEVVRELLVNALVHRPYTQQGDIYLNLHPERLEVVNPGRLPLGVTPRTMLHASRRRNEGLARLFHDLGLMEREGSGFDLIYDRLLSQGRPAPFPEEGPDWVKVTIQRRIAKPEVMHLVSEADARFQLTQRERITLGVLAQSEGLTARELSAALAAEGGDELAMWLGRLQTLALVQSTGRTQGTRYFVDPTLLRGAELKLPTTLRRIEPHRLLELVREDVRRYPGSKIGEISERIGAEVARSQLKRALADLVQSGTLLMEGQRNGARYRLGDSR